MASARLKCWSQWEKREVEEDAAINFLTSLGDSTIPHEEQKRVKESLQQQFNKTAKICLYGSSASTCSFASALGFFSLVGAGALLLSDARLDRISSIPTRKRVVTGDLAVSAIFAVIFLIAFFTFWSKFSSFEIDEPYSSGYAKFGILLALLSTLAWGGAAFFAWRRYEEGAITALGTNFDNEFSGIDGEVQDGYGYGGSSDGIGAVGVSNTSYQAGAPPTMPPTNPNPFVGTDGYGY
ncbi:synaptophysin / synaptoporin [Ancylostoma ceylanicum]|uniref:Synaptophysin / synaptoporin n=1 Tax=Ancylostoma ceylanicum TaxID=53326 RepID=A0A0D6M909_9BILA|nr:synaptophysin / synaptoporin [Ancylostoma ceylanicum]